MALKRKITKAEYDALDPLIQAEYKGDGAGYVLDTDDDNEAVETLRRALANAKNDTAAERTANKELKDRLDEIDRKIKAGILTEAEANKDVEKLKAIWQGELETVRAELTGKLSAREKQISVLLLGGKAESMARELAGDSWKLLLPHIKARLSVDMSGDTPSISVLTEDGNPSTLTLEDLKKEFLQDKSYAAILVGVKSSGGGAGRNSGGGAPSKKPEEYTTQERTDLFNNNREEFNRIFGQ